MAANLTLIVHLSQVLGQFQQQVCLYVFGLNLLKMNYQFFC